MPKGKGTYGSKVGRPPKKKYQRGGVVTPGLPVSPLLGAPPVSDARLRMTNTPLNPSPRPIGGGSVGSAPGFGMAAAMRNLPKGALGYKKGGKVKNKK